MIPRKFDKGRIFWNASLKDTCRGISVLILVVSIIAGCISARTGPRRPIIDIAHMPLEYWIDEQIVAIIDRQQTARGFIRPVDRKGVYKWYKPVLKPKTVV